MSSENRKDQIQQISLKLKSQLPTDAEVGQELYQEPKTQSRFLHATFDSGNEKVCQFWEN